MFSFSLLNEEQKNSKMHFVQNFNFLVRDGIVFNVERLIISYSEMFRDTHFI